MQMPSLQPISADMTSDPSKYLGLRLNNQLAIKLMKEAEKFYLDFIEQTGHPDLLILHQVNELIINHLEKVFSKYPARLLIWQKKRAIADVQLQAFYCTILKMRSKIKK